MFGMNPQRPVDLHPLGHLAVQEVFYTIQGEGPHTGRPAVFVRLAGCNLACWYCDTDFESAFLDEEQDGEPITLHSPDDLMIEAYTLAGKHSFRRPPLLVLTGGEPTRQNIVPFIQEATSAGWDVQMETHGLAWPFKATPRDLELEIVVSPKSKKVHRHIAEAAVAWKYIVKAGELSLDDGLPVYSTQVHGKAERLARPWDIPGFFTQAEILLQPMEERDLEATRANMDAAIHSVMKHGYRLSVQVHKVIGMP